MRLYGNDMDDTTTVLEADLGWIVGWKKDEFIGAEVLRRQKAEGVPRKLMGFEVLDRGIARHGHDVFVERRPRRRRHERHADAVLEEVDRHGVPAGRVSRRGDRVRDRRARPPPAGAGRADAVLQAARA